MEVIRSSHRVNGGFGLLSPSSEEIQNVIWSDKVLQWLENIYTTDLVRGAGYHIRNARRCCSMNHLSRALNLVRVIMWILWGQVKHIRFEQSISTKTVAHDPRYTQEGIWHLDQQVVPVLVHLHEQAVGAQVPSRWQTTRLSQAVHLQFHEEGLGLRQSWDATMTQVAIQGDAAACRTGKEGPCGEDSTQQLPSSVDDLSGFKSCF
jgi:hypothetical protein